MWAMCALAGCVRFLYTSVFFSCFFGRDFLLFRLAFSLSLLLRERIRTWWWCARDMRRAPVGARQWLTARGAQVASWETADAGACDYACRGNVMHASLVIRAGEARG
ncbi:hypothetical protein DFH08DRAFT_882177 [Mycena albidolilacea]|uniref:Uncharacterized protein n=1 Tax=Mycena albidolilacea TaxID=1033008 RepID=A0AAD6ZNJ4_9AGAR|nr:hypothetical protein DFH08DRAFT_882177 [Mycena albidolilacea]